MSLIASYGQNTAINGITGEGIIGAVALKMGSKIDAAGRPPHRCRHVLRVLKKMTHWMVSNRGFEEIDTILSVDGARIATGRIRYSRADAMFESANSTFIL